MNNTKTKGIFWIISAAFFFALMALFVRLAGDIPSMQKSFFRNLVAFFAMVVIMVKNHEKPKVPRTELKYLILRSIMGTIGIIGNFYAIDHLVLSDASMLNKLSPFFAIVFSFFILKEKCSKEQIVAVIAAFVGALFIIKPAGNLFNAGALVGVLGGMGAGCAYTFVRLLGQRGVKGNVIILFFSGFSTLVAVPFMIPTLTPMTWQQTLILLGAGVAATGGQVSITKAYFYAPAKELSVFDYSQIIFSALMGFFVLGQVPDRYSILGYVIICSMAVWMFLYNKRDSSW